MPMKSPVHPGRVLREDCLKPLGLTVKAAAGVLHVSRQALSHVVNERAEISPEMAIRIEQAFGGTADAWLRMQTAHNLAACGHRRGRS